MIVQFAEWLPDLPAFANPGALTAKNVIPAIRSYRPLPSLVAQTTALDARCLGAFAARDADANVFLYAGDATKLYELTDNTFTDESKGGGYSTVSGDRWEFVQFGTKVIATNFTDPVQSITIGGGGVGAFADHITSTNKPKAHHMEVIRDFLVLGNTTDATDGHVPNRVWWSGINDSLDFDPDSTTQSDYQDLPEGGWVTKIVGGVEYGLVFQERRISRMPYSGSPKVFDFYPVDRQRGTPIPNSVVGHGRSVFFISEEGFFAFDGSVSGPIGIEKVDKTFWGQFDIANKDRVSAAVDPVNKVVVWAFPGAGSSGGNPNKLFFYHWVERKWTEGEIDVEFLLQSASQGYTLEGLDAISTNIDTGFTESFDAAIWKGGASKFGAFNTSHKFSDFTGANLAATLDTGEAQLALGKRALVTELWPLVDGGTLTSQVGGRNILTETVSFDPAADQNAVGFCPVRNESRYQRFRSNIAAGGSWEHAQGFDVTAVPRGRR